MNKQGLHARPAAEFVKAVGALPEGTKVTVNGVDGASLLGIMALGLTAGAQIELVVTGPQARDSLKSLQELIESGFGE